MTKDEAARTPDDAHGGTTPPAPTADERPRPRYGEYAPEGWDWQPPADDRNAPAPAPVPQAAAGPGTTNPAPYGSAAPAAPGVRSGDRAWTIALLVLGAVGAIYNSVAMISMPGTALQSAQVSAEMLGTTPPTSFTPGPGVTAVIAIGVAAQIALWIGALLWSRARLRVGARSWWIPLVAGVVAFVVVMIVGLFVLTSDPALFEIVRSGITPTPTP